MHSALNRNRVVKIIAAMALFAVSGCTRLPVVEFDNLPLVASLRTACSARNEQWLAGVEKAVAERHNSGKMSEAEKAQFDKLIAQARGGDWQGADKHCYHFERAQLNRTRETPAEEQHSHSHSHAATPGLGTTARN